MNPSLLALFVLRVSGTTILVLLASALLFIKESPPPAKSPITSVVVRVLTPRRTLIVSLLTLTALTYFIDAILVIILAVLTRKWQGAQEQWWGIFPSDFLGLVAFLTVAILGNVKEAQGKEVWSRKRVRAFAIAACALDITIVLLMITNIDFHKQVPSIPEKRKGLSVPDFSHLVLSVLRLLFSIPLLTALCFPRHTYVSTYEAPNTGEASTSGFLAPNETQSQYGTFTSTPAITNPPSPSMANQILPKKPDAKQEIALDPTWSEMFRRLRRLAPYLWPKKSRTLQLVTLCCILILVLGRFVNLALPLTFGHLVAIFEQYAPGDQKQIPRPNPWPVLGLYVVLRFLQGSGGLAALRDSLWAPVMQYSDREMSQLTFNHLLNLSLSFHTRRKTGEILRILDRGAAINHILELILFNILPTLADMIVALVFFLLYFTWSLALVLLIVMVAYISASIALTTWRTKIRRKMNDRDVITRGIHTDCLLNYETVKYFGGEDREAERYADAIRVYQRYEYQVMISLNLLNLVQTAIITLGLLGGSVIVANDVVNQVKKPADFVVFITYLAQLYGPLNNLGYVYRSINQSLVDTERLFKLLDELADVNDKPGASELEVHEGEIEFDNVTFSYDGRTDALKGVTFKVPKGSKVALVGESGSGKSTILRLLFRFYDLKEGQGRILVDGKDIRDVTQASLRKAVGVVPQDSVLFNTSIAYNIEYGKFGAPASEIENAAKLAQMHDRIITFPDGYETKVGERGVRLSGGEKQRVAIARTLLKNPPILLLDEATSALDTSTERDIQKALQNLIQGRSSLSIAHRLSTIASADLILVLSDGQIVEQGTHKELLHKDGIFAKMWADQVNADRRAHSPSGTQGTSGLGLLIDNVSPQIPVAGYDAEPALASEPTATEDKAENTDVILNTDALVNEPEDVTESYRESTNAPETVAIVDKSPAISESEYQEPEIVAEEARKPAEETGETPLPVPRNYVEAASVEPKGEKESSFRDDSTGGAPESARASIAPASAPIAFPTGGDDAASLKPASVTATPSGGTGGITFSPEVNSPPSRSGTPDPDAGPKRKRISSQNFQRLAKKITMVRRNSSSASFDPDASTSSLESPGGATKNRKSRLRRKSTGPPPASK